MDKNLHFYWCRTRVKGVKRLRKAEALEDEITGVGQVGASLDLPAHGNVSFRDLGIEAAADTEAAKSEASAQGHLCTQTCVYIYTYTPA